MLGLGRGAFGAQPFQHRLKLLQLCRYVGEFDATLFRSLAGEWPHLCAELSLPFPKRSLRSLESFRGERPFVFTNIRDGMDVDAVAEFIVTAGMLRAA